MSAGEWIAHDGKGMPVAGDVMVDVLMRWETFDDFESDPGYALDFIWAHDGGKAFEITHYKVVA